MSNKELKEEISKLSDLGLANKIHEYSNGSYIEMLRDEALARIVGRLLYE